MDIYLNILITIFGSLLGVVLTLLVPGWVEYFKYAKLRDVTGKWYSEWKPLDKNSDYWTKEEVEIRPSHTGKMIISNRNNIDGFQYEGTVTVHNKVFLIGVWRSTLPGSSMSGPFMLTLEPRGRFMFGACIGPNDSNEVKFSDFVIAREEKNLAAAKRMLDCTRRVTNNPTLYEGGISIYGSLISDEDES
jgi:hypothetical protein